MKYDADVKGFDGELVYDFNRFKLKRAMLEDKDKCDSLKKKAKVEEEMDGKVGADTMVFEIRYGSSKGIGGQRLIKVRRKRENIQTRGVVLEEKSLVEIPIRV